MRDIDILIKYLNELGFQMIDGHYPIINCEIKIKDPYGGIHTFEIDEDFFKRYRENEDK